MAKYLVETYYTCSIKVSNYLDDISENSLKNLEMLDLSANRLQDLPDTLLDDFDLIKAHYPDLIIEMHTSFVDNPMSEVRFRVNLGVVGILH